jgi:hypothetical protein
MRGCVTTAASCGRATGTRITSMRKLSDVAPEPVESGAIASHPVSSPSGRTPAEPEM